ncbi:MAG: phosphotransferase family protein [Sphingobium sp.]|nr:phosphotransferase family protein [Sphingobium sp.]MBP8670466.1 phosphotransferase family protein [Sphingobium sp.]MBP9156901.1 phosphotransferase family protein [Sphingobium sp.]MCC6481812.1 phosphotransferase family protein [Sphingomonadaceae bacterium]
MAETHFSVDMDALVGWMDGAGLGKGPVSAVTRLTGGTQNILLRFIRDGRDYVLRRPPEHPRAESNETMRRESRLLAALARTDVPHPALIAACSDKSVLGAAFYLMEPVDGFNATAGLPSLHAGSAQIQHRMGLSMIEGLVALAQVDYQAVGLSDFGKPEQWLERQVGRWANQLASYDAYPQWPGPGPLGDVGAIGEWLERHRPAHFMPGILHGDYHLANVMFRNNSGEVAAIIDWELATIGDPLVDLGWMLATWPDPKAESMVSVQPWIGFPTAAELVAHYRVLSGRDFDAGWYAIFGCYKLGILLEGTFARSCAGKAPEEIGNKLHARAQWLMGRAARWITEGAPTRAHGGGMK